MLPGGRARRGGLRLGGLTGGTFSNRMDSLVAVRGGTSFEELGGICVILGVSYVLCLSR